MTDLHQTGSTKPWIFQVAAWRTNDVYSHGGPTQTAHLSTFQMPVSSLHLDSASGCVEDESVLVQQGHET
jgi:hypothetical protein